MKKSIKTLCLCASIAALGVFGLAGCDTDEFANATEDTIANYIEFVDAETTSYDITSYKLSLSMLGMEYEVIYTESQAVRPSSSEEESETSYITTITALVNVTTPEYTFGSGLIIYPTSSSYYIVLDDETEEGSFSGYLYSYVGGETTKVEETSMSSISFEDNDYTTSLGLSAFDELYAMMISYEYEGETYNMIQGMLEASYTEESDDNSYTVKKLETTTDEDTTVKYQVVCNAENEDLGWKDYTTIVAEFKNNAFVSYTYENTYEDSTSSMSSSASLSQYSGSIETPDFVTEYETANSAA